MADMTTPDWTSEIVEAMAGAALMPADYYLTGTIVAALSLLGAVWIWLPEYRQLKFWSSKENAAGTLAILLGAIVVVTLLVNRPDPLAGKSSELSFYEIRPVTQIGHPNQITVPPDKIIHFNLWMTNRGVLPAFFQRGIGESFYAATPWPDSKIDAKLEYLTQWAEKTLPDKMNTKNALMPGDRRFMTPTDIKISSSQYDAVVAHKAALYVFVVMLSRDAALHGSQYRLTRICLYFYGSFSLYAVVRNDFTTIH